MSTVLDYQDRLVDLLAWERSRPTGDVRLLATLALPGEGGKIVTGIHKLCQWVIHELYQTRGSKLYEPADGTLFLLQLRRGEIRTQLEAEQALMVALGDVTRNLRRRETSSMPTDERLRALQLISVSFSVDHMTVTLGVVSEAGTSRTVLAPLPITPTSPNRLAA